jgi:hypothetical protein
MPYQVHDAIPHAMSGNELSRVRTELRLFPPEPIKQRLLASRGADIVIQSSGFGGPADRVQVGAFECSSATILQRAFSLFAFNFLDAAHRGACRAAEDGRTVPDD